LAGTGLNSPTEILRIARLRYLGTLYRCQDLVPWGLLNSDKAWTRLLADDLEWMWHQLKAASALPHPAERLEPWEMIWCHHQSYWKRLVRRAGEHALLQRQRRHRVGYFHERFCHLFEQVLPGHFQVPKFDAEKVETTEHYGCMQCQQVFASKGGLGAHCFRKHGVVARVRLLFDVTSCGACLKEYHTFSKLQAHLRNSGACRRTLWGRKRYTGVGDGTGSLTDRHLCRQHDGILPPLQGFGPLLPACAQEEIPEYDLELAEEIYLALVECEGKNLVEQIVRDVISTRSTSWQSCRASLHYLIEELTAEDIVVLDLGDYDIKQFLQYLATPAAWPFLQASPSRERCLEPDDQMTAKEQACEKGIASAEKRAKIWDVPRPMARERYLIHAFSGRRRMGDFQQFVEAANLRHPATTIFTISVDLMVDPIWGDVSREEVRAFWIRAVRDRFVVGALAGPPCETWSQARGRAAPELVETEEQATHPRGPRVLRDMEEIWGRAALALREIRQLDVGNLLLLFTLELLINLALEGGIGCLEHPGPPEDATKASIWRLPVVQFLLAWPEFEFLEISQGLWGAPSRKPTGLMLLNMQHMVAQLRKWQVATDVPRGTSIGLTKDGIWATSLLKEYPPALCAGLAGGFVQTLQEHPVDEFVVPTSDFRRQAKDMLVSEMGPCAGPDFAR